MRASGLPNVRAVNRRSRDGGITEKASNVFELVTLAEA
jgi:hypothetical protein